MLSEKLKNHIAEVQDFPKPGVSFKDISPLLLKPELQKEINQAFIENAIALKADYIAGIESRGFLFGMPAAIETGIGFIPIRKEGKLPRKTIGAKYDLEYGQATLELHINDIPKNSRVIIHDDLLATGGTAQAAQKLIEQAGSVVCGFQFIVELSFLKGRQKLKNPKILSLALY